MRFFDPNNPNEKKKMIAAAALALVAILVLGYVFFGGGSSKPQTTTNAVVRSSPSPTRVARPNESPEPPPDLSIYQPVSYTGTVASASEADGNIFSYYEPTPTPPKPVIIQTPSPTPTPPLVASGMSPSSVYARTPTDFSLQLTGDK